jgi:excisionase family DNA binding protein
MKADEYLSTKDAARHLGITRQRVLQLIKGERLRAEKFADVYMIRRSDLAAVQDRPPGRPPKAAAAPSPDKPRTIATKATPAKRGGK